MLVPEIFICNKIVACYLTGHDGDLRDTVGVVNKAGREAKPIGRSTPPLEDGITLWDTDVGAALQTLDGQWLRYSRNLLDGQQLAC